MGYKKHTPMPDAVYLLIIFALLVLYLKEARKTNLGPVGGSGCSGCRGGS